MDDHHNYSQEMSAQAASDYNRLAEIEMQRIGGAIDRLNSQLSAIRNEMTRIYTDLTRMQREYFATGGSSTPYEDASMSDVQETPSTNVSNDRMEDLLRPMRHLTRVLDALQTAIELRFNEREHHQNLRQALHAEVRQYMTVMTMILNPMERDANTMPGDLFMCKCF